MKRAAGNHIEFHDWLAEIGVETVHGKQVEHYFARHTHRHCCIGLVETGAWELSCRGRTYTVQPGQVYIIPPAAEHSCRTLGDRPLAYRTIMVADSLFAAAGLLDSGPQTMQRLFRQIVLADDGLYRQVLAVHRLLASKETRLGKQTETIALLAQIVALQGGDLSPASGENLPRGQEACIRQAQAYIDENYADSIAVQQLAQVANTSPYYLIRLFGDIVGVPPHIYQQQARIRQAKQLLSGGEALVDVAVSTGFVDQSHFTKTFKKMVGVTPKQYQLILRRRQ